MVEDITIQAALQLGVVIGTSNSLIISILLTNLILQSIIMMSVATFKKKKVICSKLFKT
jgi:hypothetical protein